MEQVVWALASLAVVLLPLVPSVLIYKIFPDEAVSASGRFGSLTWKSSGAFSAYVIVLSFIVIFHLDEIRKIQDDLDNPVSTVRVYVQTADEQARVIDMDNYLISLERGGRPYPAVTKLSDNRIRIPVTGRPISKWPIVQATGTWGSSEPPLILSGLRPGDYMIDHENRVIKVKEKMKLEMSKAALSGVYKADGT